MAKPTVQTKERDPLYEKQNFKTGSVGVVTVMLVLAGIVGAVTGHIQMKLDKRAAARQPQQQVVQGVMQIDVDMSAVSNHWRSEFSKVTEDMLEAKLALNKSTELRNVLASAVVASNWEKRNADKVNSGEYLSQQEIQEVAFANTVCTVARRIVEDKGSK